MKLDIAYGKEELTVDVPDRNLAGVLRMQDKPVIQNPMQRLHELLDAPTGTPPLAELAKGKSSACIVISDITRPVPNEIILTPMLEVIEKAGISRDAITILNATGMHRPNEGDELVSLVGKRIADTYRIVNHKGREESTHRYLGDTPHYHAPMHVDTRYLEADLRIVTGLIEPHLMAGFSGGRKAIMPGICGFETLKVLHGAQAMSHPKTVEGVIDDNPFHADILHVARTARVDFMVNVTLNERREITGIFAGELEEAHREGVSFMETQCIGVIDEPVDAVITSSAGYPLDLTFYQAIKGITAAVPVVKENGVIIIAAKLGEGVGSPEFTKLVTETESVDHFLSDIRQPGYLVFDQWQFQKFCMVRRDRDIWLYSDGIDKETQNRLFVRPIDSLQNAVDAVLEKFGGDARIAVIPEGPYVLARTAAAATS